MRKYKFFIKTQNDSRPNRSSYDLLKVSFWGHDWKHAKHKAETYVNRLNNRQSGTDRTQYSLMLERSNFHHRSNSMRFTFQRNWIKYLIVLIILSLAWQSYQQKETIFSQVIGLWDENTLSNASSFFTRPKIDSDWIHNFIFIINNERTKKGLTALKESNDLNNIANARFKKMMENPMVSHYGAGEYNVGEVVFYPAGFTEEAYADDIQKNAQLHWDLLMDSSFSAYGYHIEEGDTVEVYQPCSITEIPGPNIDVKEFFRKQGCSTNVVKSTWLVIDMI